MDSNQKLYTLAGVVAVVLLVAVGSAQLLLGGPAVQKEITVTDSNAQIVMLGLDRQGYTPSTITLEAGKEVVLKNDGTLGGCGLYVVQPQLGINTNFAKESEYRFTPEEKGTYTFTCSMGMYKGTFNVV